MEAQFEVKTSMDQKLWVDFYRIIWRKRLWWIAIIMTLAVFFGFFRYMLIGDPKWWYICYFTAYSVWLYFRPWLAARKAVKLEKKFDAPEENCAITKFSDAVYDESKNHSAVVPFDKFEKIHIGKYVILMEDVRKTAIILDKNGFTKGTLAEFLPYIQEKCPQMNLPKW